MTQIVYGGMALGLLILGAKLVSYGLYTGGYRPNVGLAAIGAACLALTAASGIFLFGVLRFAHP